MTASLNRILKAARWGAGLALMAGCGGNSDSDPGRAGDAAQDGSAAVDSGKDAQVAGDARDGAAADASDYAVVDAPPLIVDGRPLLVAGEARLAPVARRGDWSRRSRALT